MKWFTEAWKAVLLETWDLKCFSDNLHHDDLQRWNCFPFSRKWATLVRKLTWSSESGVIILSPPMVSQHSCFPSSRKRATLVENVTLSSENEVLIFWPAHVVSNFLFFMLLLWSNHWPEFSNKCILVILYNVIFVQGKIISTLRLKIWVWQFLHVNFL